MDSVPSFAGIYRETVLAHGRAPQGVGELASPARQAVAHNAVCGDRVSLGVQLDAQGRIVELRHQTTGCLLCTASASLMSVDVQGLDAAAVERRCRALQTGITRGEGDGLGELAALTGVSAIPSRYRCVLLPWEALQSALPQPETGS